MYTKEGTHLENSTFEDILRVGSDKNYSEENYHHVIDLFMTKRGNGSGQKRPRRPDDHNYTLQIENQS